MPVEFPAYLPSRRTLDRDSYNSGDWYNALDWTYSDNNWGHGLLPADKNQDKWDLIRPLLVDPALAPDKEALLQKTKEFQQRLHICKRSPLFRLETAE